MEMQTAPIAKTGLVYGVFISKNAYISVQFNQMKNGFLFRFFS